MVDLLARRDPILGGWRDGYPHTRDETGFCVNCGSMGFAHYALVPKRDAPIYRSLIRNV